MQLANGNLSRTSRVARNSRSDDGRGTGERIANVEFAVVSDVHADEHESKWTHVLAEPPAARTGRHPLADLIAFVEISEIKAKYLFVPGDLANQADAVGLTYAWRRIQTLADRLEAKVMAVPGNHDVVTHTSASDPRGMLKSLLPSFPTGDIDRDRHFWERGWCVVEDEEHRFLLLDSTIGYPTFPPGATKGDPAWVNYMASTDRGSLTEEIEDALDQYFRDAPRKLNVALIHHHPQEHQLRSHLQDGYGPMRRGSELIDLMSRYPTMGRWMVVHGHKHVPQLAHATSLTSNGPLLLCAGSVGAKIWDPVSTVTRNQFHLVSATDDSLSAGGALQGTVASYSWGYGVGWQISQRSGAGLAAKSGFGSNETFQSISHRLVEYMNEKALEYLSFAAVVDLAPQLPYLLPADLNFLEDDLEREGFAFFRDRHERVIQLSRVAIN